MAPALPSPLPIVGRGPELDALLGMLEPGSGPGRLALVAGERGAGKSRLMDEVAARARADGWSIARGQAYPMESGVPYALVSDAFLPLLRTLDADTLAVLSRGGEAELSCILPGLARDHAGHASAPGTSGVEHGVGPDELRTRVLWTFSELLRNLVARRPLLVILEDLDRADDASVQLLHFLARQDHGERLALMATVTEGERGDTAARALGALAGLRRVSLQPLHLEDTLDLLARLLETDAARVSDLARTLFGWTRGNPFFLSEILAALAETGRLDLAGGDWARWEARALPRSIRDAVLEHVDQLSADARRVAETLAVVGARARHALVLPLSRLPEDALLAAVGELRARGIVTEREADGAILYDFVHPLVRETLYAELGLARARALHGEVAEALEALLRDEAGDHADELAYHCARTDVRRLADRAVGYLAAAGRAALARHADREAATYLDAALRRSPSGDRERLLLIQDLARARLRLGEYDGAIALWREARREHAGSAPEIDRRLGLAHMWSGRLTEALDHLDSGVAAARAAGDGAALTRLHLARGACLQELGRSDEARADAEAALALAEGLDAPGLQARAHRSLALLHTWTGPPTTARAHGARALALAEQTGDTEVAFWSRWGLITLAGLTGDTAGIAAEIERLRALTEELRSPVLGLWVAETQVEHAYASGDWDGGVAIGERAIALARALHQRTLLARLLVWTSILHLRRGDEVRARGHVDEACRLAGMPLGAGAVDVHAVVPAHIGLAHYLVATGEYREGIRIAEEGLTIADGTGYVLWSLHRLLPILAEAYLWSEDPDGASAVAVRMREHALRLDHRLGHAWADACDAFVVWKRGDPDGGARRMRAAAEALEAIPWVPDAARIRRQLAGRLAETGDREGALAELRVVHETFTRLGAERELEKTRVQFREVGSRPPPRGGGAGAAGLTERELEIARLVAGGRSNKAVGKELGISARTVSTHLSNIFQKLELGSRNQLSELVRRSGL